MFVAFIADAAAGTTIPVAQFWVKHASDVSDWLKIALVLLALITVVLSILGDKYDKEAHRITRLGYRTLGTGVLVALCGVASWFADKQVKAVSDQKTDTARAEQKREDQEAFAELNRYMNNASRALEIARETESKTLAIAMTQLPIEQIKISIPRSDVQSVLPRDLIGRNAYFHKPKGSDRSFDDDLVQFNLVESRAAGSHPKTSPLTLMESFQSGEQAWRSFGRIDLSVCHIAVSSTSIAEEKLTGKDKIGGDDFALTDMSLDDEALTYVFEPRQTPAAVFDGNRIRMEIAKGYSVAVGGSRLPDAAPCLRAKRVRVTVDTLTSQADTGLLNVEWKDEFARAVYYGPMVKLRPNISAKQ